MDKKSYIKETVLQSPSFIKVFYNESKYDDDFNIFESIYCLYSGHRHRLLRSITCRISDLMFKNRIKIKFGENRNELIFIKLFKRIFIGSLICILPLIVNHSFSCIQTLNSVGIQRQKNEYKYQIGFMSNGFYICCIKEILDKTVWFCGYYLFNPFVENWLNYQLRKYLCTIIIYPFDTIRRRQIITNQNIYSATKDIYYKYGILSFYDGIFIDFFRIFLCSLIGKLYDFGKYRYIEYKYDVSGKQKRRKQLINLIKLCKNYKLLNEKEDLLIYGYCHNFMKLNNKNIYIPLSLIELIKNKFIHDTKYDINKNKHKLDVFINKLSNINILNQNNLNDLLLNKQFNENIILLWKENGFSKFWKNTIYLQIKQIKSTKEWIEYNINKQENKYYFGKKRAIIYCDCCNDKCNNLRYIRFRSCGHFLCETCTVKMRTNRYCPKCKKKYKRRMYYDYTVPR